MSDVPYLNPGHPIDADSRASLVDALNTKLKTAYSDYAAAFLARDGISFPFGWRKFFFCDTITPADTLTAWRYWITNYPDTAESKPGSGGTISSFWKRAYTHDPFTDFASAAVPDDGNPDVSDPAAPVVRVLPYDSTDWTTAKGVIWPGATITETAENILEYSLEPHKFTGGDYDGHLLYVAGCDNAEYPHYYEQVEIILGEGVSSPFEWPQTYTKYRLYRFSNMTTGDIVIKFPRVDANGDFDEWDEVTIEAMSSRCVRRVDTLPVQNWVTGYEYFQLPLPADPWFLGEVEESSVTSLAAQVVALWNATTQSFVDPAGGGYSPGIPNLRVSYDGLWDLTGLYCGPPSVSVPSKTHFPTPTDGWFPALADSSMLGNYVFHKGKALAVTPAGPWTITRSPNQDATVSGSPTTVILLKADGSIARGVEDLTVSRDGIDIPAGSDPDLNWALVNMDPGGPTDHWELGLFIRTGGLADGDELEIAFKHLTDDQKAFVDFKGFETLADDLGDVGIDVTDPAPGHANQILLSSSDDRDLIGLSTNLILGSFGSPGVKVTDTEPDGGALLPYFPNLGISRARVAVTLNTDTLSDSYKSYTGTGTDWSVFAFNADVPLSVDSQNYTFAACDPEAFKLTDTVDDVFAGIGSAAASGVDYGENDFGAAFTFTVFGAAFRYAASVPMDFPFAGDDPTLDFYQVNQGYGAIVGDGDTTPYSFGVVDYEFLDGAMSSAVRSWPTPGAPLAHYPRVPRVSSNLRTNDEAINVLQQSQPTVERPSLKAYYESKPWRDAVPIEQTTAVELGGQMRKRLIAILQQWSGAAYDVFARLSAWAGFDVVTYRTSGGTNDSFDASEGSAIQSSYYTSDRATLLSALTGNSEDAKIGYNSLCVTAESYNTLASIVNAIKAKNGDDWRTLTQEAMFEEGVILPGLGRGLGTCNYRPREQYFSWNDDDYVYSGGPTITDFVTSFGFTIKDSSDFPTGFAAFMTDDVYWYSPPSTTTSPDGSTTTSILDAWAPYHGFTEDDVTKYRWVTIDEAKTIFAALGFKFVMEELSCPATFEISTGTPSTIAPGDITHPISLTLRPCILTAAGWFNDPDGEWVYTPENRTIRAETPATDRPVIAASNQDGSSNYAIYDPGFSDDICTRLYYNASIRVNPAAAQVANHTFLFRRYGCQFATAVVWGVNYFPVTPGFSASANNAIARLKLDLGLFEYNVKTEVDDLETGAPEVTPLTDDETLITTEIENGKLIILRNGYGLS